MYTNLQEAGIPRAICKSRIEVKRHPNGNLKNIMVFFGLARIQVFPTPLSPTVKRVTKTCNLFCNIAAERVEKPCCAFYRPRIKPVLQQIKLLQVTRILASGWTKLRASHAIHGSYVTCCKTSFSWDGKTRNIHRLCCKK